MAKIKLTQGKMAIVDDEDFELISQHKWCTYKNQNMYYAGTKIYINGTRTTLYMHQLILKSQPNKIIDHKNRDGLDRIARRGFLV